MGHHSGWGENHPSQNWAQLGVLAAREVVMMTHLLKHLEHPTIIRKVQFEKCKWKDRRHRATYGHCPVSSLPPTQPLAAYGLSDPTKARVRVAIEQVDLSHDTCTFIQSDFSTSIQFMVPSYGTTYQIIHEVFLIK